MLTLIPALIVCCPIDLTQAYWSRGDTEATHCQFESSPPDCQFKEDIVKVVCSCQLCVGQDGSYSKAGIHAILRSRFEVGYTDRG